VAVTLAMPDRLQRKSQNYNSLWPAAKTGYQALILHFSMAYTEPHYCLLAIAYCLSNYTFAQIFKA
jgi:hypothetical protein